MQLDKESSRKVSTKRESSRSRTNASSTRSEVKEAASETKLSRSKTEAKDKDSSRPRASSSTRAKRQDSKTREPADRDKAARVKQDGGKATSTSTRVSSRVLASGDQVTPSRGAVPKQVAATRDSKKLSSESRKTSHSVVVHSPDRVVRQSVFSSGRQTSESQSKSREERHSTVREAKRHHSSVREEVKEDRVHRSKRTTEEVRERDKTNSKHRRVTEETKERKRSVEDKTHRKVREVKEERKPDVRIKKETSEEPLTKGRTRTRTRVLSPSEVKMEHHRVLAGKSSQSSDHVTTTSKQRVPGVVRQSSELSHFPVALASASSQDVVQDDDEEVDYEDDFEDYESDFEDDSEDAGSDQEGSVVPELTSRRSLTSHADEEKKLDSGHYDMGENQRRSRHLEELRAAIDRENSAVIRDGSSANKEAPLPVDEGFEEERSEESRKNVARPASSFINFAHARKRQMEQKVNAATRKRGDDLLGMISLDVMSYKIYESAPASYDLYMASYGRSGTAQAQVQTNDENLDEETQTDEVRAKDVWTQKPPARGAGVVTSTVEQDRLGVGGDVPPPHTKPRASLDDFLARVAGIMTVAIQEGGGRDALRKNTTDIGFSKGFVKLKVKALPFLKGRAVTLLRYPAGQSNTLLTVHAAGLETHVDADARQRRSVLCVWSVSTPATPQHVLASWRDVTAACFDADRATLVLAGLDDGAVCCWDLREAATSHEQVNDAEVKWLLRSPSYSTAEVLKDEGHSGPVLSLQPLIDKDSANSGEFAPSQVCSLEESGVVIIWTVIQSVESGMKSGVADQDLGMAYWGRVRLVKSASVALEDNLQMDPLLLSNLLFTNLRTNTDDCNHLYVTTNTGHVVHGLKSGAKPTPRLYHARSDGLTFAKCIETFPFGHSLFLVGCGDGSVRLHRRESENPLTTLAGTGDAPGQGPNILDIQWSRSRPTIFFVLDEISRIHVWDLGQSDMYPRFSTTLSDAHVTAIQMAPDRRDAKSTPQMAIATLSGSVEVHHLKDDYCYKSSADMTRELNNFIRFTNIL